MSRLDELIAELCPDGVTRFQIGEICNISRGRVMSKDYIADNSGEYPVFSSQTENNGELGRISSYDYEGEFLTWTTDGANAGTVFYRTGKFSVTNVCGLLSAKKSNILMRYLYYILSIEAPSYVNSGMGNPKLMSNVMARIKVPIPPLEIQREIVRILDKFTALTAELQAQLQAELQARKKQYAYYRNLLLTLNSESKKMQLSDVADLFRGEYITQKGSKPGNIPVILGGQEPAYYIDKANHEEEIVVIARSGVSAGFVSYWNQPIYVTDGFGYEAKKDVATPKYLYYALKRKEPELNAMKRGAGVPHVSGEMLGKVELSIPSIAVQERLVCVLDNFEAICSDLSIGLPAEIEARQKQYEYYRDKLLTFQEKAQA